MRRGLGILLCAVFVSNVCLAMNPSPSAWQSCPIEEVVERKLLPTLINDIDGGNLDNIFTQLQILSEHEQYKVLSMLLNTPNYSGLSSLMYAVIEDSIGLQLNSFKIEILASLLGYGANPNLRLKRKIKHAHFGWLYAGWTACHLAIHTKQSLSVLKKLRQHKGDFFQADNGKWTPLELAIYGDNQVAIDFILGLAGGVNNVSVDFSKCSKRSRNHIRRCEDAIERWELIKASNKVYEYPMKTRSPAPVRGEKESIVRLRDFKGDLTHYDASDERDDSADEDLYEETGSVRINDEEDVEQQSSILVNAESKGVAWDSEGHGAEANGSNKSDSKEICFTHQKPDERGAEAVSSDINPKEPIIKNSDFKLAVPSLATLLGVSVMGAVLFVVHSYSS